MKCPHCENQIAPPRDFWIDFSAPWHCSYCGELFGIRNIGHEATYPIQSWMRPLSPIVSHHVAKRWCYYSQPLHYVYALCYPNGIPFYVGLGSGVRAVSHAPAAVNEAKNGLGLDERFVEILRLEQSGDGVWYHFLALTKSRKLAAQTEAYWICKLGIRNQGGILTNLEPMQCDLDEPPAINEEEHPETESKEIETFNHPDFVVQREDTPEGGSMNHAMVCCACGGHLRTPKQTRDFNLICPVCGHYTYGIDFRERFPLKQFTERELLWSYRVPHPPNY